jgi:hypothetical protein
MKLLTQRIDTCQHCPYCWANGECAKLGRCFNEQEEKISKTDVQSWCPLPDEKDEKE